MAYPFVQLPIWRDLRDRLCQDYQCSVAGAPGAPCITRRVNGQIRAYPTRSLRDGDRVSLTVLRSMLDHLKIPKSAFGLPLG